MREKLLHVEATTGKRPADLDGPEPPEQLAYLLGWFADLGSGRPPGFSGPAPLTWEGILAWATLTGVDPRPWEIALLRRLDLAYLDVNRAEAANG